MGEQLAEHAVQLVESTVGVPAFPAAKPCERYGCNLLPIALIFSDSSMTNLQSVSIIAAFPIGIVIVLITASFLKDARKFLKEPKEKVDTSETQE